MSAPAAAVRRAQRRARKARLRLERPWRCPARLPGTRRRCCLAPRHPGAHSALVGIREDAEAEFGQVLEFREWTAATADGIHEEARHGTT